MTLIAAPIAGLCMIYVAINNWDREPLRVPILLVSIGLVLVPVWLWWRSGKR